MPRGQKRQPETFESSEDASAVASKLKKKRTNDSTKLTYKSKTSRMMAWLRSNYSTTIDELENRIRIPLPNDAVLGFFGHICREASKCDETNTNTFAPLSASCIKGYRSALVDLYRAESLELDPSLNTELKTSLDGYEKLINDLKKRGLMDIIEGKRHLKSTGYSFLAHRLMQLCPESNSQSWSTTLFAWPFFVIMWNLMRRCDSVDSIMLQHLDWQDDALIIEEQGHKGDQTGADKFGKHIYANPCEPHQCPILALAVLLFCRENHPSKTVHQLFCGTDSKNRFGKILRRVLNNLDIDGIQALGCPTNEIGTHSLRKGSSTYALGQINGPNPVSVFLRMGQGLGKLKDRYIHFGEGADQLCGRMVCGLPFNDESFACLPPHFSKDKLSLMDHKYWCTIAPGFDKYPHCVKTAFPFLLASLIHHEDYLRSKLQSSHPLFSSRVFTHNSLLHTLRHSTTIYIGSSPELGIKSTGVPPHLAIASKVNALTNELSVLKSDLSKFVSEISNSLPNVIASKVVDEIKQNFVLDGVAPATIRDIDSRFADLRQSLLESMRQLNTPCNVTAPINVQAPVTNKWKTWCWNDGRVCHFVPPDWEFPSHLSVKKLWELWHFGDQSTLFRPYKQLVKCSDVKKSHHMRYCRAKAVMAFVDDKIKLPLGVASINSLDVGQIDGIFETAYTDVIDLLYASKTTRRIDDISYARLYNVLCAFKKQKDSIC